MIDVQSRIVTFSGGLGAQLLSLAIVLDARRKSIPIGVNLDYFNWTKSSPSSSGGADGLSYWPWELMFYGFSQRDVFNLATTNSGELLEDGPTKLACGLAALRGGILAEEVTPSSSVGESIRVLGLDRSLEHRPYMAVHIRRGDYLKVASHLVPDHEFASIISGSRLLSIPTVVVSDTPLSSLSRSRLTNDGAPMVFLDSARPTDAGHVHNVLRHAALLVGSNSQFSLTAGLMSDGLFMAPSQWFGAGNELLENVMRGAIGDSFGLLLRR
jgi:hypothetical protein